jgi:poly-gamma-glutamate synthesis protein (capsule biosynthesis protein)
MFKSVVLILLLWQPFCSADTLRVYNLGELLLDYDVSHYPEVMDRINQTADVLKDADAIVGNLETTVRPDGLNSEEIEKIRKNASAKFTHHTPKSALDVLTDHLNVNFVSLANNHSFDLGTEGVVATLEAMKEKELVYAGIGYNEKDAKSYKVLTVNGKKIAFFSFTNISILKDGEIYPGSLPTDNSAGFHYIKGTTGSWDKDDKNNLTNAIARLKEQDLVDYIFVYGHIHYTSTGGFSWSANGHYPTDIAREVIDAGADTFFIEGPHSPKGFEVYKDKPIFYGVGNSIFNTRTPVGRYDDYRWYSYITDSIFVDKKVAAIKIIPMIANEVGLLGDDNDDAKRQLHWETRGFAIPVSGDKALTVLNYIQNENKSSDKHDFSTVFEIKGNFAYWPSEQAYQKALQQRRQ